MNKNLQSTAVIGCGVMGAQIAQVFATHGYEVSLLGIEKQALAGARDRIENGRFGLHASVARGKLTAGEAEQASSHITYTSSYAEACADSTLIVEAVPEKLSLKQEIFAKLGDVAKPEAILASNTAGLSITELASVTSHPERVLGWHWSQPAVVMQLAEIVVTPITDKKVINTVEDTARRLGKNPVVIQDLPGAWGFVTNRIMATIRKEAEQIVADGVATQEQVDTLLRDCFRWPFGPFEGQNQDNIE